MAAKTMVEQKNCQECRQKCNCQNVYQQLGEIQGRSVVVKVIVAFLLPLVVFIISLAVFGRVFNDLILQEQLRMVMSVLPAFLVTFVVILVIRLVNKQLCKNG